METKKHDLEVNICIEVYIMERKIISISSKRQITIPLKFFLALGFSKEAECIVRGNELVIRPARENYGDEFAEQILSELIEEGFSGNEMLDEFKKRRAKVRTAVEKMINEAGNAALGKGEYYTYNDIFGAEDEE